MRHRIALAALLMILSRSSPAPAQPRTELQFPDLPGYRTLKCDFHVHTVFSDGLVWPTVRVDEAWREGLDAIAITDHIEYQPHQADLPTNFNRSTEIAQWQAHQLNILVIRGAEITRDTPPGHFNALFLTDINPLKTDELLDVFDRAAEQGAFVFWNHPAWKGAEKGKWAEVQQRAYDRKQLQGIEICNGDSYYEAAHHWAMEKGLALIGNSDVHDPAPDKPYTPEAHRTLTLVFAKERSVAGIQEALRARRTAVWWRNKLIGRQEYLSGLFAAAVEARPIHHLTKDQVFFEVANRCELDIDLGRQSPDAERTLVLPARSTSLLRLPPGRLDESNRVRFRAENFLVGPGKSLEVTLTVPATSATRPN